MCMGRLFITVPFRLKTAANQQALIKAALLGWFRVIASVSYCWLKSLLRHYHSLSGMVNARYVHVG